MGISSPLDMALLYLLDWQWWQWAVGTELRVLHVENQFIISRMSRNHSIFLLHTYVVWVLTWVNLVLAEPDCPGIISKWRVWSCCCCCCCCCRDAFNIIAVTNRRIRWTHTFVGRQWTGWSHAAVSMSVLENNWSRFISSRSLYVIARLFVICPSVCL